VRPPCLRILLPAAHLALLAVLLLQFSTPARGAEPAGKSAKPDAELRHSVVGTWHDEYQGRRTMTVRADGTATMLVQLQGWKAALYASELQFDMVWSIEAGRLKKRTTGGRPATRVKAILATLGDQTEEQILELTANRLLLLDRDGKRQYDWRRVPAPADP
jgi:hypothetical protein